MRLIGLEEHFLTLEFLDGPGRSLKVQAQSPDARVATRYTRPSKAPSQADSERETS